MPDCTCTTHQPRERTVMEHDFRDVLRKAASYVEQGWCQYALARDEKGDEWSLIDLEAEGKRPASVCMQGSLDLAAMELTVSDDVRHEAFRAARAAIGFTFLHESVEDLIGPRGRLVEGIRFS